MPMPAGKGADQSMRDEADELQFLRWRLGMVQVPAAVSESGARP